MTKQEIQKLDTNFLGHRKPLFSLSMVELWERFAFYGIRSLLVLFMATTISKGGLGISTEYASAIYGIFAGCLYLAARFLEAGLLIIIQGKKGFISRFFYYNFRTY